VTYLSNGDGQFGISDVLSFGIYQLAYLQFSLNYRSVDDLGYQKTLGHKI
jgi:hypothetical protein